MSLNGTSRNLPVVVVGFRCKGEVRFAFIKGSFL